MQSWSPGGREGVASAWLTPFALPPPCLFIIAATGEVSSTPRSRGRCPGLPALVIKLHDPDRGLVRGWDSGVCGFRVVVSTIVYHNRAIPN